MSGGPAPVDALTEEEKEKVRYHLGYGSSNTAASYQLGMPFPLQTTFLLERAITLLVNGFAVNRARCILQTMDGIECKIVEAQTTLAAEQLGQMTLHPLRSKGVLFTDSLEREYVRWGNRLADLLMCPIYPFAERYRRRGPGSNVRVG